MPRPDPNPFVPSFAGKSLGPRAAMIFGFLALLVLMAVLSFDAMRAFRQLETSSAHVRQDSLTRERTLRDVRFSLYESGNLLREYALVSADRSASDSYLAQLHTTRDRANSALEQCLRSLHPDQKPPFQKLANELASYWLLTDRIFVPVPANRKNDAALHELALAQRSTVLSLTREVSDINELDFHLAEQEISSDFAETRHRVLTGSAIAISLGLLLAASAILYVSYLERQARERYEESLRSQHELKELSKRLVDAQEQERRAIARELHDQIGQSLTGLLMDVQTLADAPQSPSAVSSAICKMKLLVEECVNQVRNMALLLRPSMLDDLGLVAALQWQAREVSKRHGLVVDVIDDHFSDDLPEDHRTCVYRIVQEALHNCVKHAHAHHARVLLKEDLGLLTLSIEDDGVGLDPSRHRGMGFLGMQERVTRLGGTFLLDSALGRGTRLYVELPLAPVPQPEGVSS